MKYFLLGFLVKTIASFDDTLTRITVISAMTKTERGKIAFSVGTFFAVSFAMVLAYAFSSAIEKVPFSNVVAALLIYVFAYLVYFNLLTPKSEKNAEKKLIEITKKASNQRLLKLMIVGFVVSFVTLIDDIVIITPLFLEKAGVIFSVLGIYTATIVQIVIMIYSVKQFEKIPHKREIASASLVVLAFLVLLRVI